MDPASLDLERSLRDRLSRFAVERRDPQDGWKRVGLFATGAEAARELDLVVAMHGGTLADYRIERIGLKRWVVATGWVAIALIVLATVVGWVALAS